MKNSITDREVQKWQCNGYHYHFLTYQICKEKQVIIIQSVKHVMMWELFWAASESQSDCIIQESWQETGGSLR